MCLNEEEIQDQFLASSRYLTPVKVSVSKRRYNHVLALASHRGSRTCEVAVDMNQRELLERLKVAMDGISRNPKTAAEVAPLFEDFVVSMEEIAHDLGTATDEQVARDLEEVFNQVICEIPAIKGSSGFPH